MRAALFQQSFEGQGSFCHVALKASFTRAVGKGHGTVLPWKGHTISMVTFHCAMLSCLYLDARNGQKYRTFSVTTL